MSGQKKIPQTRAGRLLLARIEELYMERTGKGSAHGAATWFADYLGVHRNNIYRWLHDTHRVPRPVLCVIEGMERERGYLTAASDQEVRIKDLEIRVASLQQHIGSEIVAVG